ncbi:MAG: glucuronate isomerase [Chitinophagales bacterium]
MKAFLDEQFLLHSATAERLYHSYAEEMPIIDYHSHLPPAAIAGDHQFENLTQAWLYGDHYKWRAMRTNGVDESYCTGEKSDWEKFEKWAATVPFTLRNPLYHWAHMELQRYFDCKRILNPESALSIYSDCTNKLHTNSFTVRGLLRKMKVKLVCTTDDPLDDLASHKKLKSENFEINILPTFRPDAAMYVDDPANFRNYIRRLEKVSQQEIRNFNDFKDALKSRHDYFEENGCRLSDHGLKEIFSEDYTEAELKSIFSKVSSGRILEEIEKKKFNSAMLNTFAEWDWEKGWVQQFHLGAIRNNNSRMREKLGADTGWDSIGDARHALPIAKFLDRLDAMGKLAKTILYNLNPADNALMATMTGNFNDGSLAGKIQWGSAWWFLDQKDGMESQLNTLSNMGLLSRFVGMITDSRSFLSYPRHEYFRRILCNLLGTEIEKGELPNDLDWTGKIIQDICFHNAKNYFGW